MKPIILYTTFLFTGVAVASACGGSDSGNPGKSTSPEAGTTETGGSSAAGAGGATSAGGKANGGTTGGGTTGAGGGVVTGCTLTPCEGKKAFGQDLTACCMTATQCGVSSAAFMAGQCLSADLLNQIPDASAFTEKIVLDPTCPDLQLPDAGSAGFGFDAGSANALKGCCDKTNVCGVAFTITAGPLTISQCYTPADQAAAGMGTPVVDAGPSIPCTYK